MNSSACFFTVSRIEATVLLSTQASLPISLSLSFGFLFRSVTTSSFFALGLGSCAVHSC